MKIILKIHGKRQLFNEQQLTDILEKHFAHEVVGRPNTPAWGEYFWISPFLINRYPFYIEREDEIEELLRQRIVQAFEELDEGSTLIKYNEKEFKAIVPKPNMQRVLEKNVTLNTIQDLINYALNLGGSIASETEQALEWAQRLDNGESWQAVAKSLYIGGDGKRLLCSRDGTYKVYSSLVDEPYIVQENSLLTALPLITIF